MFVVLWRATVAAAAATAAAIIAVALGARLEIIGYKAARAECVAQRLQPLAPAVGRAVISGAQLKSRADGGPERGLREDIAHGDRQTNVQRVEDGHHDREAHRLGSDGGAAEATRGAGGPASFGVREEAQRSSESAACHG